MLLCMLVCLLCFCIGFIWGVYFYVLTCLGRCLMMADGLYLPVMIVMLLVLLTVCVVAAAAAAVLAGTTPAVR